MQLVKHIISNLKYFRPPTSLSTDQQRQHSILLCSGGRVATIGYNYITKTLVTAQNTTYK